MESGIFDARGRLIEDDSRERVSLDVPRSADEEKEGSIVDNLAGANFTQGNFYGNIVIRDQDGRKTIEILKEGTILMYDRTHPRVLIGKQIGGF